MQKGFTLIELVVVIGIFTFISGVVFFRFSEFNANVSLENLTQDIAVTIRRTQAYALGFQTPMAINPSYTVTGYGIHFGSASEGNAFRTFADIASVGDQGNRQYDGVNECTGNPTIDEECIEGVTITTRDQVTAVCPSDAELVNCYYGGDVAIVFERPNPNAFFCIRPFSGAPCNSPMPPVVTLLIESQEGTQKKVTVWNTGQISIQ